MVSQRYFRTRSRSGTLIAANTIINYPLLIGLAEMAEWSGAEAWSGGGSGKSTRGASRAVRVKDRGRGEAVKGDRGAAYAGGGQKPITLAEYSHWSCCQKKRVSSYNISYGLRSLISFVLSPVPIVVSDPLIPR